MPHVVERLDRVVIRIAGDSGDGMQLTGDRFTQETAMLGNDVATFPNFPAEIRAPQGGLAGVSSFQLHFADHDILTPGDRSDALADSSLSRKDAGRSKNMFRSVERPTYDERRVAQVATAQAGGPHDDGAFDALLRENDTWKVDETA